jgi:type I restriction enzyme R subunit
MTWLTLIKDHVAESLSISVDDFEYTPFNERGGIGKVVQVFGDGFNRLLDELNEALAA